MEQFSVMGLGCAGCASRVEKAVSALAGVSAVKVTLPGTMEVAYAAPATAQGICQAVEKAGYRAAPKAE